MRFLSYMQASYYFRYPAADLRPRLSRCFGNDNKAVPFAQGLVQYERQAYCTLEPRFMQCRLGTQFTWDLTSRLYVYLSTVLRYTEIKTLARVLLLRQKHRILHRCS